MKPQYSDFEIVGENYILVAEDEIDLDKIECDMALFERKPYLKKLKNYHIYQLLFYQS